MKNLQIFIHRHYDTIKLILIVLIAVLTFLVIMGQNQQYAQDAINREQESIAREKEVARLLENDHKKTNEVIENQERGNRLIVCLLAAHGQRVEITPEDEEACNVLVDEAVNNPTPIEPIEPRESPAPASPQRQSQTGNESNPSSPDNTPEPAPVQRPTSQPTSEPDQPEEPEQPSEPQNTPEPNVIQRVIQGVDNIVNGIVGGIRRIL